MSKVRNLTYGDTVEVRVIKPVGYHDDHEVGEIIDVSIQHVNQMIKDGYVELFYIVTNRA